MYHIFRYTTKKISILKALACTVYCYCYSEVPERKPNKDRT